ncbi:HAMP domain-containing protein [bacterium]|nr:MAG: HAMP domain-containing protein [bacterium]
MNLGRKLILTFLVVAVLPTSLLAYLTMTFINKSMKDDAQETVSNNLKAAWMLYNSRVYQMQYGMLQASTEFYIKKAIKDKDKKYLRAQLKAWRQYRPHVDIWAIVDTNARVIASYNTERSGQRFSMNGLVEKALSEKKSFISTEILPADMLASDNLDKKARIDIVAEVEKDDKPARVITGESRDGLALTAIIPVTDEAGLLIGAIIIGDLINNDPFVPDSFAEAIPGSLLTIAMRNIHVSTNVKGENGERTVGSQVPEDVLSSIEKNRSYRGYTKIARKHYLMAFDPIVDYRGNIIGSLFVGVLNDRFVELQYENSKAVFFIALISVMLATGVASFITFFITKPISVLTKKAQMVSAGNLKSIKTNVAIGGSDEIAGLARTFDVMIDNIRDNESRLSTQKNLIESIINSLPYCLYVIEPNLGIVEWNRHANRVCSICNRRPDEDCYKVNFIAHLYHYELKEGVDNLLNSVFETGIQRSYEQKIYVTDTEVREIYVRISVFPIFSERGGSVDYVVWMAEDITKQKGMEASIITSEKLSAIGQLAAGIAHEVNNPLGGILNCLYNFENTKLTDERKKEYLDFMEDGIKRVQNIVRQLLDFSQQHAPEFSLIDINGMIEGIIPLFLHSIKGKDIRFDKDLGPDLPSILVDRHQTEQVLVNLILNAMQAVGKDGVITVATRLDGRWFCITVADNGSGISPEKLPKIFDPFFTTKGVGKGTGLGLSVSRGIIEGHKGRIEVESHAGKGTVFKVYLPVALREG